MTTTFNFGTPPDLDNQREEEIRSDEQSGVDGQRETQTSGRGQKGEHILWAILKNQFLLVLILVPCCGYRLHLGPSRSLESKLVPQTSQLPGSEF